MPESYLPQRIVSLQPSITVTLRDLGLLHRLVACTKYCLDVCPELSQQQCLVVEDSWTAKAELILAARPDLVIASVPYQIEALAEIMKAGIPFVGFSPKSLSDVYSDIATIARIAGAESKGFEIIHRMRSEILAVQEKVVNLEKPLVYCEEWGKPLILSQKWVAELVEAAAGRFYGEPGKQVSVDQVQSANPDVIIAAWCGAGDRVPLEKIIVKRGWEDLKAVRQQRVYCINDEFLNTPASTLIDGLRALASAIQPDQFATPPGLRRMNAISSLQGTSLPTT
ncbi:MAG TPA: ABC transporter substrate-binding protein [Candidatus Angelobacter sp.]|jgi:iron complex transport system substrate-binding protein|nr:ABC transporter substrate-binding protein [Candidatus Angelobacter sp.]